MIEDFTWSPALVVGHPTIDGQHRELFQRANQLFAALRASGSESEGEEVRRTLRFLNEYVVFHFADEERFMDRIGYPQAAEHRAEHRDYVRRLQLLDAQFDSEAGSAAMVMAAAGFLRSWLLEHIGRADVALVAHARAMGAAG